MDSPSRKTGKILDISNNSIKLSCSNKFDCKTQTHTSGIKVLESVPINEGQIKFSLISLILSMFDMTCSSLSISSGM